MKKTESEIICEIDGMLTGLDDAAARQRIILWTQQKFGEAPNIAQVNRQLGGAQLAPVPGAATLKEIPGVACLSDSGAFRLTVRDLKAKNTKDAAIRLAHVIIIAHEKLTGEPKVSSRKLLVPILKEWRAYDGNTRVALANYTGILRDGDNLSLDTHAKRDAERYLGEILDDKVEGKWSGAPRRKRKDAKKGSRKSGK